MPASLPFMPFWINQYLSKTGHLSFEAHGVYLRLLLLAWQNKKCRMPADEKWIAHKLGVTVEVFGKKVRPVIDEFWTKSGRYIFNKKQKSVQAEVLQKHENLSNAARARKTKEKEVDNAGTDSHGKSHSKSKSKSKSKENENSNLMGRKVSAEILLKEKTITHVRTEVAKGYDVYALIRFFTEHNSGSFDHLESIDGAFVNFCKKHVRENPL